MVVNPILKDYMNMNNLIKGTSLKILPHLYQHEISDIIFNTLYKGSFDKNIFIKKICILSFFKLMQNNTILKNDILEIIENFLCYGNTISGLSLIFYDFSNYNLELDFFHQHFKTFCKNLIYFSDFEIAFIVRFMNLYTAIYIKEDEEDYQLYKTELKKCLYLNNMELVVEIIKHFWNFREFREIDICLMNLLQYLNEPVSKKYWLLKFILEILKKSKEYFFELFADNYEYFFGFDRENKQIKILKLKILGYLISPNNYEEIYEEVISNCKGDHELIKAALKLGTKCLERFSGLKEEIFLENLKKLINEKILVNEVFRCLCKLAFKSQENEFFKLFCLTIFVINDDDILVIALKELEKLFDISPEIIYSFLLDFWQKKFKQENLNDLKKIKESQDSYLDVIFFQFHLSLMKKIESLKNIDSDFKLKFDKFFDIILYVFIKKNDFVYKFIKKSCAENIVGKNLKEIVIKKDFSYEQKNKTLFQKPIFLYFQFADLSLRFPKLKRNNFENISKNLKNTEDLRIKDNQEKLKKIIMLENKISQISPNNSKNNSLLIETEEISNLSCEEAPEEANEILNQFLNN